MQRQQNLASHVEDNRTIVGAQTEIRGSVEGTGEIRVHGSIEGKVQLRGILHVEDGGLLKGDAGATQIFVDGIVLGDLSAEVSIVLRPGARVVGALVAPRLEVMEGAQFRGPIRTESQGSVAHASHQARAHEPASRSKNARSPRKRAAAPASRSVAHDPEATVVVTHPEVKGRSESAAEDRGAPAVSAKLPSRGKKRAQRRESNA